MLPVFFEIPTPWGIVPVYSYGAFLGLGVLGGWALFTYLASAAGPASDRTARFCDGHVDQDVFFLAVVLAGFIGARIGYGLLHPLAFDSWWDIRDGGLDVTSGIATGLLAASAVARRAAPGLVELSAPSILLGFAFTSIGSYLCGDHPRPLYEAAVAFVLFPPAAGWARCGTRANRTTLLVMTFVIVRLAI